MQHHAGLPLAGMTVLPTFQDLTGFGIVRQVGLVDHVGLVLSREHLHEQRQEIAVAAMPVVQDDLIQSIARHLIADIFQQCKDHILLDEDTARQVHGFDIDSIRVKREDDGGFALRSPAGDPMTGDRIRTQRQVGSVGFDDADGDDTNPLAFLYGFFKIK